MPGEARAAVTESGLRAQEERHIAACVHYPHPPADDPRVCRWCAVNRARIQKRADARLLSNLGLAVQPSGQIGMRL